MKFNVNFTVNLSMNFSMNFNINFNVNIEFPYACKYKYCESLIKLEPIRDLQLEKYSIESRGNKN